ncbi:RNA polymerase sigma-70 factor [Spirosoma sp. HMF3257]|uniref:RNA polymerase sigma-70 factor n=1 Tax=Spirosoma telluris TaxID=2183553 RepID=A0A327NIC7_9BACT|nr:RNA polymerase sigma-70 factor [Spirosoma telluris]RAI74049.1 RNA polymerase sigma-70 factor [Spirosoma telluris]
MIALQPPIIHKPRSVPPIEQDILSAIRDGNERAFESVFRQYYAPLCRYARQFLPDSDEAEEEVQAMFLVVWEKRDELYISVSLKSYLYRAVHNRCLNRIKHASVRDEHREHTRYLGEASVESPMQMLLGDELSVLVQRAIQKLPEQCRLAFTLSRFEELKYSEIADQLGISIKTVENQIGKALRILRAELSEYLPIVLVVLSNGQWIMNNVKWPINNGAILVSVANHYTVYILHYSFYIFSL